MLRHLLERAGFFEQMRGARDDFQPHVPAHLLHCALIELDDGVVVLADDEKRRRQNARERGACEIRPAAA
jgi:hypothetical protein